jgi:ABC-type branched-subunit amino acid transport system ATPase component
MTITTPSLRIDGLAAGYGGFLVLRDLVLETRGRLTVILGPNGAGKTTLLKAIAGLMPRSGRVRLGHDEIAADEKASDIVRRGLVLVPEGRQLFAQMSVHDNVELGGWLLTPAERAPRVAQVLRDFPKLAERARQLAGTMSGGEQQMLAVGRALMSGPRLILLDEPSMGLAPVMVLRLFDLIRRVREEGYTILVVEQNVRQVLKLVDRAYLLEVGRIKMEGRAETLADQDFVRKAYVGL